MTHYTVPVRRTYLGPQPGTSDQKDPIRVPPKPGDPPLVDGIEGLDEPDDGLEYEEDEDEDPEE